jgi:hypothetical protein
LEVIILNGDPDNVLLSLLSGILDGIILGRG